MFSKYMDLMKSPDSLQVDSPDPHPFACVMLHYITLHTASVLEGTSIKHFYSPCFCTLSSHVSQHSSSCKQLTKTFGSRSSAICVSSTVVLVLINSLSVSVQHDYETPQHLVCVLVFDKCTV